MPSLCVRAYQACSSGLVEDSRKYGSPIVTASSATTMGNNPANAIAAFGVGPAEATGPVISSDGSYIAYANNSSNLLSTSFSNYDGRDQVYQAHITTSGGTTTATNTLISYQDSSHTTTPIANGATAPAMSSKVSGGP